jgi:hypothetical protein
MCSTKTPFLTNGSSTQWYKNVLKNPSIRIDARGAEAKFRVKPITAELDVAVVVQLT